MQSKSAEIKKELIFKNPNTKLRIFSTYIQFYANGVPMLLGYRYIKHIYINKTINNYITGQIITYSYSPLLICLAKNIEKSQCRHLR